MQSKNAIRKARRYGKTLEARYTVQSSWPDMIQDKRMLNWSRMHRSTKAKHGVGAR